MQYQPALVCSCECGCMLEPLCHPHDAGPSVLTLHSRTCMHWIACMRFIIIYSLRMLIAYLHAYIQLSIERMHTLFVRGGRAAPTYMRTYMQAYTRTGTPNTTLFLI